MEVRRTYPGRIPVGGNGSPENLHPSVRSSYYSFYSLTVREGLRPPDNHRVACLNFRFEADPTEQRSRFWGLYLPPEVDQTVREVDEGWGEGDPGDRRRGWFEIGGIYVPGHLLYISRVPIVAVLEQPDQSFRTRTLIPQPPESQDHRFEGVWATDNAFAFLTAVSDRLRKQETDATRVALLEALRQARGTPVTAEALARISTELLEPPKLTRFRR